MTDSAPFPGPAFELIEPETLRAPLLFNSPHSGASYPQGFLSASRLDPLTLRRSEDAFVDALFAQAPAQGAMLMRAHFPRAYLDVNREAYELDPRMFIGTLPPYANTRSLRVAGGLGTIARLVGEHHEIYRERLTVAEGLDRVERLYKPYHAALAGALGAIHRRFGVACLVDCHSMPSSGGPQGARTRADMVLGDRYATSCAPALTRFVEATLSGMGYSVAHNKPYAGGFITEHYGNPSAGLHAIQVEINRGLYMDEARVARNAGFSRLSRDLSALAKALAAFPFESLAPRMAAE